MTSRWGDRGDPPGCFSGGVLTPGVVWQAFAASVGLAMPRTVALRMIGWYQEHVSAGRGLCSRPAPFNCSARAAWVIGSYGLLAGGLILVLQAGWFQCGREDPGPGDAPCFCDCI
jgi:putative component of membrane protein insertase Oxa1/YidC/SpoIIIJ protein YidD